MTFHCQIIGCSNGSYRLKKWEASVCEIHQVPHDSSDCLCEPPFSLYPLPTRKKKPQERDTYKRLISRLDTTQPGSQKLASPSRDARICSLHFRDGKPTPQNPFPTEQLGYPGFEEKVSRVLRDVAPPVCSEGHGTRKRTRQKVHAQDLSPEPKSQKHQSDDFMGPAPHTTGHCYAATDDRCYAAADDQTSEHDCEPSLVTATVSEQREDILCMNILSLCLVVLFVLSHARLMFRKYCQSIVAIVNLTKENSELKKKVSDLEMENGLLKQQVQGMMKKKRAVTNQKRKPGLFKKLIKNRNISYYTGVESKTLFQKLHDLVKPFVKRRWQGSSKHSKPARKFRKSPSQFGPKRFLASIDEMLLVFMRLRLGLDLRDLSDRFSVSASLAGRIFTSWISALAATLGTALVYLPDRETVRQVKPKRYRDMKDLMCIIDCTEFFIETPQDLQFQCATWSNYKHHNTLKVLISVLPNSMISFVSRAYEGSISDRDLTRDCQFLQTLPPYTTLMADEGFAIAQECAEHFLHLAIPPGRRGQSQMPSAAVKKTKQIANKRILVEQVIRRLKTFKLLKNELPITALHNIDDVIMVCASLCNMKKAIYAA